ncbi:Lipid A 3-O-deacylase (PagL) [Marivirga sericea]|uniref:Lipid A 3-O-deacylase (PagL) n=1 Tax=Marivirga sericea TaxID=1028 RepID=A0A1X7ILH0_9BACT|nr:acyloxyacyl hydrolase [Marivirga sericea]SMG15779.1 Lipid A 3-O-deacylase (PagL) [Marivirga sericea]
MKAEHLNLALKKFSYRFSWIKYLLILILITLHFKSNSQGDDQFLIPEISIGSIVPNYLNSPTFGVKSGASLTYYKNCLAETQTNRYYNYPLLGIQAGLYRLGNPSVYGNEINLMPILGLKMNKGLFQWGIGPTYHTKTYKQNSDNLSIGSHLNWSFQWMYYRSFHISKVRDLRVGFGYRHSSNGHTQLPNYGLNSAIISVSIIPQELNVSVASNQNIEKSQVPFIKARAGVGLHEFGSTTSPIGGEKKLVFSQSLAFGFIFKKHFRWYAGFGNRHYQHFADSIKNSIELQTLNIHPNNFFFLMGVEYLIYHVGISIEGGINISKPFYYHFAKEFENTESIKYTLKKLFPSRMGLKLYLINTAKEPKHNIYISAHINANFGQADFSEASLGYVYNF